MPLETRTEARATFVFHALESDGREASGTMAAASAEEVARKLRSEGRTVLSIGRDEAIAASAVTPRGGRARRGDLALLCRHLGTMADAGVPISEALDAAATEGSRPSSARSCGRSRTMSRAACRSRRRSRATAARFLRS